MMVFSKEYTMPQAGGAIDGGLRGLAAHGHDPWLVKEEFGAEHSGIERQSVVGSEGVAQRDAESCDRCR